MTIPTKAVDRIFERMAATYGSAWTNQWRDVPMADVKTAWAQELAPFGHQDAATGKWRMDRIAWALENLPERCPNAIEFKNLCRHAPTQDAPALPEPKADPARVAAELAKLGGMKTQARVASTYDGKAWARTIMARHEAGEKVNACALSMARSALRANVASPA